MPKLPYEAMLLRKTDELPVGPNIIYEPKFDGYRMFGIVGLKAAKLWSRKGNDFTEDYPPPAEQLPIALGGHKAVVDGEMIALDKSGHEDFDALKRSRAKVIHYIFDLPELDGVDLTGFPLGIRLGVLHSILVEQENVRLSPIFYDRDPLVEAAREQNREGVVAKDLNSPYIPGPRHRTRFWQKQKFRSGRHFLT